jgi:hypothetical protein
MSKDNKKDNMDHDEYFEDDGYEGYDEEEEDNLEVHDRAYYLLNCVLSTAYALTAFMFLIIVFGDRFL